VGRAAEDPRRGRGAATFSLVAAAYAAGSTSAGIVLARIVVSRKAFASMLAWFAYLPGCALFAVADSIATALAAGILVGLGRPRSSGWPSLRVEQP
jgi:hypothetical protein